MNFKECIQFDKNLIFHGSEDDYYDFKFTYVIDEISLQFKIENFAYLEKIIPILGQEKYIEFIGKVNHIKESKVFSNVFVNDLNLPLQFNILNSNSRSFIGVIGTTESSPGAFKVYFVGIWEISS